MNRRPCRERGTAAIEMVFVLLTSILLLGIIVLVGRLTWHATSLVKSVADTTRIVATLPRTTLVGGTTHMKALTERHVRVVTESAGLDLQPGDGIDARCGGTSCTDFAFTFVTVNASIRFYDTIFGTNLFDVRVNYNIQPEYNMAFIYRQTYARPPAPPAN
ncbi:TadE/TadG family type IV pilus assembly protein [Pseudoduganella lutea]|uniref:Pilus assembly protein n=1 Tax=Pseudoduganella lutea TaxID=321985 RepID=A0A4P6KX66_9BURK|nr:hypothetical protein [Pseudoduganella lutea]QBE63566.1 hypothetical protein EWM63_11770 [Pseudoduganella lutea]